MKRLHTANDMPAAELSAAVLDGDAYVLDACWASIAEPEDEALRAAAFAVAVSDAHLVAERLSAAWIWGARSRAPVRHQACLRPGMRGRGAYARVDVRETAVRPTEVVTFATGAATTPARTISDILRSPAMFGPAEQDAVVRLGALTDLQAVRHHLDQTVGLPHVSQAIRRWLVLFGA